MKKLICLLALVVMFSGCATARDYNKLRQPEGSVLTASIGSIIFRVNKSGDLPNVFGKADLWGGKVDKGFTELRLKGITEDGNLILQISDVNLSSTETTMDRYKPFNQKKVEVSTSSEINIGNTSTPEQTVFEFDPKKEKSLVIGGVRVTFIEMKPYSVVYKLNKEQI